MQKLTTLSLISKKNTSPKHYSKKGFVGASTKNSCYVAHDNNEKSPQLGALNN